MDGFPLQTACTLYLVNRAICPSLPFVRSGKAWHLSYEVLFGNMRITLKREAGALGHRSQGPLRGPFGPHSNDSNGPTSNMQNLDTTCSDSNNIRLTFQLVPGLAKQRHKMILRKGLEFRFFHIGGASSRIHWFVKQHMRAILQIHTYQNSIDGLTIHCISRILQQSRL